MLICDADIYDIDVDEYFYVYSHLFLFNFREVEAWGQTLASLVTLFEYIDEMLLPRCEDGNLLSAVSSSPNELMSMLNTVPQYSFYGRCLGFHVSACVGKALCEILGYLKEKYRYWQQVYHEI